MTLYIVKLQLFLGIVLSILNGTDCLNSLSMLVEFISSLTANNHLKSTFLKIEKDSFLNNVSWNHVVTTAFLKQTLELKISSKVISLVNEREDIFSENKLNIFRNSAMKDSTIFVAPFWQMDHLLLLRNIMKQLMPETRRWLLITTSSFPDEAKDLPLLLNNKVIFARWYSHKIILSEVYKSNFSSDLVSTEIGVYEQSLEKKHSEKFGKLKLDPWGRRNMTGFFIRCLYLKMRPFVDDVIDQEGNSNIDGAYISLFKLLQNILNFTYTCEDGKTDDYGTYVKSEKKWTGAISKLVNDSTDICVGFFDVNYQRSQAVKYLFPVTWGRKVLIFRPAYLLDNSFLKFTKEFQPLVWCLLFFSILACAIILWIIIQINPREVIIDSTDLILLTVEAFCNFGSETELRSNSGRILTFTLYVTTMLFYIHYTSYLVSCLAVSKDVIPFKNLQELYAKRDKYSLLLLKNSGASVNLKETHNKVGRKILQEMSHALSGKLTPAEGIKVLKNEDVVSIIQKAALFHHGWQFQLSSYPLNQAVSIAWPVRNDSEFSEIFNYYIGKCMDNGLYRRMEERWKIYFQRCLINPKDEAAGSQPMDFNNVLFPFSILGIGIVISIVYLLIEILIETLKRKGFIITRHDPI